MKFRLKNWKRSFNFLCGFLLPIYRVLQCRNCRKNYISPENSLKIPTTCNIRQYERNSLHWDSGIIKKICFHLLISVFTFQGSQRRKGYSFPDCFIEVLKNIEIEHYYTHFCAPHLNLQKAIIFLHFRTDFYFFDEVSQCRELRKWYSQTDKLNLHCVAILNSLI